MTWKLAFEKKTRSLDLQFHAVTIYWYRAPILIAISVELRYLGDTGSRRIDVEAIFVRKMLFICVSRDARGHGSLDIVGE